MRLRFCTHFLIHFELEEKKENNQTIQNRMTDHNTHVSKAQWKNSRNISLFTVGHMACQLL